jgi:signal transduction histidine kinase
MTQRSARMRLFWMLAACTGLPVLLLVLFGLAPRPALWLIPLSLGAAYPLAAMAARPVEDLTEAALRIREGELTARTIPDPDSPLAVPTRVLFDLADQVADQKRTFEARVAERTAALTRKADQLQAVGQVSRQVAALLEPEALLSFAVRVLRGTFGYDLAAVLQRTGDHLVLTACAARGVEEPPLGRAFPVIGAGAPPLAACLALGGQIGTQASSLVATVAAGAELAVPIRLSERILGVLVIQNLTPGTLDEEDLNTATTIAGQVAVALENARLFAAERQLRDLSVTEERNRMAREIHDTLAQGFMGIIMQLRAAARAGNPAASTYHLGLAEALAQESLEEARRSVWNLRPLKLEGRGIAGVLADELADVGRRTGMTTALETRGALERIPPSVEAALLRIAQESLHNAIKYAAASSLRVSLAVEQTFVSLTVVDDGRGFDRTAAAPTRRETGGGFGIGSMQERTRLLGGALQVETEPGAGCRVAARIPLKEA